MIPFDAFEAVGYEERERVAFVTMNRPDVYNAFNYRMQQELKPVWRSARRNDDVRCLVLTGAGTKAFCTGIDRNEAMGHWETDADAAGKAAVQIGSGATATPGTSMIRAETSGRSESTCWKPVIAAVKGMACGGAFYMLGEVEFVIAADDRRRSSTRTHLRDDGASSSRCTCSRRCRSTRSCGWR